MLAQLPRFSRCYMRRHGTVFCRNVSNCPLTAGAHHETDAFD
ncbi:hypothetical protein B4168_1192 [Anoxybacillus flavithermus]|nr:hypothetical protein B4168_1192 [Anoxybacillus flavithermus]OAO88660.1 hypothetical protein GT23_0316 [Parageobacillus thermoglucosidasius]